MAMNNKNTLSKTREIKGKAFKHFILNAGFGLSLFITQAPASALQIESISIRNMHSYKKFEGLNQSALILKIKGLPTRYFDRFELAAGKFRNGEDSSAFISIGPTWRYYKQIAGSSLSFFEAGIGPTWMKNEEFNNESLGGNFFFTSNIQFGIHFGKSRKLSLAVRIQHISNGGTSSKNPGTDMAGIEFSYLLGK